MKFKLIAILFFKYLHLLDLDGPACTSHYPTVEDKDINMNTHSIFCVFQGVFCRNSSISVLYSIICYTTAALPFYH